MRLSETLSKLGIILGRVIRLDFKGLRRILTVTGLFHPDRIMWNFSNMDRLFHWHLLPPNPEKQTPFPQPRPTEGVPFEIHSNATLPEHIADKNVRAITIIKDGELLCEEYFGETTAETRHISWSVSKSFISVLTGALIDKGAMSRDALEDPIENHVPALRGSGYEGCTLNHLLRMASGVAFDEDYVNYHSDINRMGRILGIGGSIDAFATELGRKWAPGTYMHYVSIDTHVIGMVLRAITGSKMIDLLSDHITNPIGFNDPGYILADSHDEPFILGGLNLTTRDYARFGLVALNMGMADGTRVVSENWMDSATRQSAPPPDPETAATDDGRFGYGLHWWLPPGARQGEFFAGGVYGQCIYVHRGSGVVIVQNAADRRFREGSGRRRAETVALFREIAESL